MVKIVEISTLEGLLPLLTEQNYNRIIDRHRSSYLYRGMPDASFHLVTSLHQNCKHQARTIEPSIIRNFTKYAAIEDPSIQASVWHQIILGRHHGLPTRLLDWSYSPLIALNFACNEPDLTRMDLHDCAVWRMDMAELHSMLPKSIRASAGPINPRLLQWTCSRKWPLPCSSTMQIWAVPPWWWWSPLPLIPESSTSIPSFP